MINNYLFTSKQLDWKESLWKLIDRFSNLQKRNCPIFKRALRQERCDKTSCVVFASFVCFDFCYYRWNKIVLLFNLFMLEAVLNQIFSLSMHWDVRICIWSKGGSHFYYKPWIGNLKIEISSECAASRAMAVLQILIFSFILQRNTLKRIQKCDSSKCFSFAQLRFLCVP